MAGVTETSSRSRMGLFVPEEPSVRAYTLAAVALVSLLVLGVPLLSFLTPLSVWNAIVLVGVVYLAAALARRSELVALETAVLVFTTFGIGARVLSVPAGWYVVLDLMAVDLVAISLAVVYLSRGWFSVTDVGLNLRTLSVLAYGAFVVWSFLAAAFGVGPSSKAGLIFAVQQFRYLVVFVLAAAITRRTKPWCVLSVVLVAIAGNLAVSIAQILNRDTFGLLALGEPYIDQYDFYGSFQFLGRTIPTGIYNGAFLGNGREFAIVLLMFVPLVVAVAAKRPWRWVPAIVVIAAVVFSIRVADSDAAWATLFIVFGLLAVLGGYRLAERAGVSRRLLLGVSGVVLLLAGVFVLWELVNLVVLGADDTVPLFQTASVSPRLDQDGAAIEIARSHPLFGLGGYNFRIVSGQYVPNVHGIHNLVFSHLAGTGVPGVIAYLIAAISVFVVTVRRAIDRNRSEKLLWGCLACAMIGFHSYSLWDLSLFWKGGQMVLWILGGVSIGARTPGIWWQNNGSDRATGR